MSPAEVVEQLLKVSLRQEKRRNLQKLHELCKAQYAGSRDFSFASIGKLWEVAGGIKARALYNAPSKDYRTLISAWAQYAGAGSPKVTREGGPESRYLPLLMKIEDPVARGLVQATLIERDKLRGQVNLLKSVTSLEINLTPVVSPPTLTQSISQNAQVSPALTASEREALQHAISKDFLFDEGWSEGASGEVFNDKGRTLFRAGFVRAVRKVLEMAN